MPRISRGGFDYASELSYDSIRWQEFLVDYENFIRKMESIDAYTIAQEFYDNGFSLEGLYEKFDSVYDRTTIKQCIQILTKQFLKWREAE